MNHNYAPQDEHEDEDEPVGSLLEAGLTLGLGIIVLILVGQVVVRPVLEYAFS